MYKTGYRTHHCNELRKSNVGEEVKLSGWIYRKRDHGGVLFIDLADYHGITQLVLHESLAATKITEEMREELRDLNVESVLSVTGIVKSRSDENINDNIQTGTIEVHIISYKIESIAEQLPFQINSDYEIPEEMRLRYRFLDLRRDKMRRNVVMRSNIFSYIHAKMQSLGFIEVTTPILTASSPEGARDFVVPSRVHHGKFYALPQAPQQFKQLLMISRAVPRYYQLAPCFRDEDSRADRALGGFYQLDLEMSFVTQEDVMKVMEGFFRDLFTEFANGYEISSDPFPRIKYEDAMLKYGSEKPDLRNPILISDVTDIFENSEVKVFSDAVKRNKPKVVVRAIPAPKTSDKQRGFFDKMTEYAINMLKAKGLAYITFEGSQSNIVAKGPIAKFLKETELSLLRQRTGVDVGDSIFFVCDFVDRANYIASNIRKKVGEELNLIEENVYRFCWLVDFPFYEWSEDEKKVNFSHNPFSMPQGGMDALIAADTLEKKLGIKGHQYDIVCNGFELSSGAIRNHKLDVMYKAFEIAGYTKEDVNDKFGALANAFKYGPPPHGGMGCGLDRMIMVLAQENSIREIVPFPLSAKGEDLMMNAPSEISQEQMKELHIAIVKKTS